MAFFRALPQLQSLSFVLDGSAEGASNSSPWILPAQIRSLDVQMPGRNSLSCADHSQLESVIATAAWQLSFLHSLTLRFRMKCFQSISFRAAGRFEAVAPPAPVRCTQPLQ